MTLKNTDNCATIKLISRQNADGQAETQEFTSDGEFYKKDDAFYITYKEHSDMGMGDSRVFLKATDKMVTIRRMGEFKSVMNYEEGKITNSIYRMPFGEMEIKINTKKIDNSLTKNGGMLKMDYSLFIGGGYSENQVEISIIV